MRAKTIAALLAATAILVALGVPTSASAKPRRYHSPASTIAFITGSADGGFHFTLFGSDSFGATLLLFKNGHAGQVSVNYSPRHRKRQVIEDDRLDVAIGRLGRFRARFVPTSTKTEKQQGGCTGSPAITEKGYFVGSFSFHGEQGYTEIHSHREPGTVSRQGATTCSFPSESHRRRHHRSRAAKEQREREAGEFHLLAGDADGNLSFQGRREESAEPEEGSPTTFQASVTEKSEGLSISRDVSTLGYGPEAEAAFLTPNAGAPLTEATLTPPAPFSGSATFHLEGPRAASWTGDLAVELPGAGKVPLTGSGIDAGLCTGRSHCTKTLPEPLQRELELGGGYYSDGSFYGAVTTTVGVPK